MIEVNESGNSQVTRLAYGDGEWQFGDLRIPEREGPHPVALIIHGGFWKAQYGLDLMDRMAEDFTARGLATWNIEYRRVGHDGGGWPGTLIDVAAAADYLRELAPKYHLDLQKVVSIGHSAGGHLALWLAARRRLPEGSILSTAQDPLALKGAISLAGVTNLQLMWEARQENSPVVGFLGGTPMEFPERYELASPAQCLPLQVPQILVHGTEDDIVPLVLSTSYLTIAQEAGDKVNLVEIPGVEHFKVIDPASEAWPPIVQSMLQLMK